MKVSDEEPYLVDTNLMQSQGHLNKTEIGSDQHLLLQDNSSSSVSTSSSLWIIKTQFVYIFSQSYKSPYNSFFTSVHFYSIYRNILMLILQILQLQLQKVQLIVVQVSKFINIINSIFEDVFLVFLAACAIFKDMAIHWSHKMYFKHLC